MRKAAGELFATQGYVETGMRQIAQKAGVSLHTATSVGRKRDLLVMAFRAEMSPHEHLATITAAIGPTSDPQTVLETAVRGVVPQIRSSLGLWRALQTAGRSDEAARAVMVRLMDLRRSEVVALLTALEQTGGVPPRSPERRAELADTMGLSLSHEAYEHLVDICGWSHEAYVSWAIGASVRQATLAP